MGEGPWIAMAAEPERPAAVRAWPAERERLTRAIERASPGVLRGRGPAAGSPLTLLVARDAAPFRVVLVAGLQTGMARLRWGIAAGPIAELDIRREDALTRAAIGALADGARSRAPITVRSGNPRTDALLADLAPALAALLAGLTDRQREAGRLLLLDGLRRSEIAAALGISRPTVSVMVDRSRLRELERFARALDGVLAAPAPQTNGSP